MKKWIEILKNFFGDDINDEEITKAEGIEEDAQKTIGEALEIIDEYSEDYTQDVRGAILTVAKVAVTPPEKAEDPDFVSELTSVDKAGARLSKATIAQLKKIGEIVGNMLTAAEKALSKKEDKEVSPEVLELREQLKTYKDAEELEKQKIAEKKMTDLEEKVEELAKNQKEKPIKKSLNSDDDDEADDDEPKNKKVKKGEEEFQWPSLTSSEKED